MWKIALRSTRARFLSFGASILAVFLGVAFVASTLSLKEMLSTTFGEIVDTGMTAAAYVQGEGENTNVATGNATAAVPLSIASQIEALPGVAAVVPDLVGPVVLVNKDGTASGTANGAPAMAYAAYPSPSDDMVSGRMPETDSEIVLIDSTAEKSQYVLGDTATVLINGEIMKFEVVGIMKFGAASGASVVMIEPNLAEQLFAPQGLVPSMGIFADSQITSGTVATLSGSEEADFVAALEQAGLSQILSSAQSNPSDASQALVTDTGSSAREAAKAEVNKQVGFISTFILAFAAIAVGVSAFVIANTFAMITRRQQREYAMLRAIGASSAQVFSVVGVQAIVVGLIGPFLGLGASALLLQALPSIFKSFGMDMSTNATLAPSTVITGVLVGVGVAFISACFSARRAALTAPVEAMRDVAAPTLDTSKVRTIVGAALTALGAGAATAAVVVARGQDDVTTAGLYGLGAVAAFIGVLVLAAPLSRPFTALVTRPFMKVGKPVVPLASGNVQRTPKRTAATASALIVGVTLTSAAAVVAASVNGAIGDVVKQEMKADFIIQSATYHIAPSAYAQFKKVDGVKQFATFAAAEVEIAELKPADGAQGSASPSTAGSGEQGAANLVAPGTLEIGATEPGTMGAVWTTNVVSGDLAAIAHGQAIVQESTAKENGWKLGDSLTLTGSEGSATLIIGAVINSVGLGMPVIIDVDTLNSLVPVQTVQLANIMLVLDSDARASDVRETLTQVAKPYMVLSIFDQDEFQSQLTAQINQMLAVIYALLGLTVVIAVLGIVNTLGLGILERTREIGLLRAIGLSGHQLRSTITLESVLIACFGTVVGLVLGVGITLGIPTLFKSMGFTELVIPWNSLGVMAALAIAVGVGAALWPAIRAQRVPVLTAIASDE